MQRHAYWKQEAPRPTLYIAMPTYGGLMCTRTAKGLIGLGNLASQLERAHMTQEKLPDGSQLMEPWELTFLFQEGESLIQRARNQAVHQFLKESRSSRDRLMFIDADLEFDPGWVFEMLKLKKDIVGCAYPRKRIEWDAVLFESKQPGATANSLKTAGASYFIQGDGEPGEALQAQDGCIPVRWLGTGFMMIQKHVIISMMQRYPETAHISDSFGSQGEIVHALFDCVIDPKDGIYLSEDYTFCKRWKDIGGVVHMWLGGSPNHIGSATYQGDLNRLVKAREAQ